MANICITTHTTHLEARFNELMATGMYSEKEAVRKAVIEDYSKLHKELNVFKEILSIEPTEEVFVEEGTKDIAASFNHTIENLILQHQSAQNKAKADQAQKEDDDFHEKLAELKRLEEAARLERKEESNRKKDADIAKLEKQKINKKQVAGSQTLVIDRLNLLKTAYENVTIVGGKESLYNYLGRLYRRVSTAIGNTVNYFKEDTVTSLGNAVVVGDYLDALARDLFKNPDKGFDDIAENKQARYKSLSSSEGFEQIKKQILIMREVIMERHGLDAVIWTDNVFLSRAIEGSTELAGIGGSPDMIVIDAGGNMHIYDFKSIKNTGAGVTPSSLRLHYSESPTGEEKKSKEESWTNQQSVYARLLEDVGNVASIQIVVMPVEYIQDKYGFSSLKPIDIEAFDPKPTGLQINSKLFIFPLERLSPDKVSEFLVLKDIEPKSTYLSIFTGFEAMLNKEAFTYEEGNPVLGFKGEGSPAFTEFLEGWDKGTITLKDLTLITLAPDEISVVAELKVFKGIVISPQERKEYKALVYTYKSEEGVEEKVIVHSFRNPETLEVSNEVINALSESAREAIVGTPTLFNVLKVLESREIDRATFYTEVSNTIVDDETFENTIPYYLAYNAWIKSGGKKEDIETYFKLSYAAFGYISNEDKKIPLKDLKHLAVEVNGKKFQGIVRYRTQFYEIKDGQLISIEDEAIYNTLVEMLAEDSAIIEGNSVLIQVVNTKGVRTNRFQFLNNVKETPVELIEEIYDFLATDEKSWANFQKVYKHISPLQYKNLNNKDAKGEDAPIFPDYKISVDSEKNVVTLKIKYNKEKVASETIVITQATETTPATVEFFEGEEKVEGRLYVKKADVEPKLEDFVANDVKFINHFPMTFGKVIVEQEEYQEQTEETEITAEAPRLYGSDDNIVVKIGLEAHSINLGKLEVAMEQVMLGDIFIRKQLAIDSVAAFIEANVKTRKNIIMGLLKQEKEPGKNYTMSDLTSDSENSQDIPSQRKGEALDIEVEKLIKDCNI